MRVSISLPHKSRHSCGRVLPLELHVVLDACNCIRVAPCSCMDSDNSSLRKGTRVFVTNKKKRQPFFCQLDVGKIGHINITKIYSWVIHE